MIYQQTRVYASTASFWCDELYSYIHTCSCLWRSWSFCVFLGTLILCWVHRNNHYDRTYMHFDSDRVQNWENTWLWARAFRWWICWSHSRRNL